MEDGFVIKIISQRVTKKTQSCTKRFLPVVTLMG